MTLEENTFLKLFPALQSLNAFLRNPGEPYPRSEAKSSLIKFSGLLERDDWSVGELAIAEKTLGSRISVLKSDIVNRIIPALEKADFNTIRVAGEGLALLGKFLVESDLSALDRMHDTLKPVAIEVTVKMKSKPNPRRMWSVLLLAVSVLLSMTVFFGGRWIGVSTDSSYVAAVGLFATIFIADITIVWQPWAKR